jgi:hypothetical protein
MDDSTRNEACVRDDKTAGQTSQSRGCKGWVVVVVQLNGGASGQHQKDASQHHQMQQANGHKHPHHAAAAARRATAAGSSAGRSSSLEQGPVIIGASEECLRLGAEILLLAVAMEEAGALLVVGTHEGSGKINGARGICGGRNLKQGSLFHI